MKKKLLGFILLFLICLLMPLVATADPIHFLGMLSRAGSIEPGESETFTAEVYNNKDGNRVSGQTVTFSVSPDDGTVSLSTTSGTTDSNGRASTTLSTGSASAGTYTVTATLDNGRSISGRAIVGGSPPPPPPDEDDPPPPPGLSIVVVHSPGSGEPGGSLTFIVEVQEDGSPAAGKTVTFSITAGDGNARLGYYGTATTISGTTSSNGRASTTIQLGNDASGSYTVTASVGSVSISVTATVETEPPPPDGPIIRKMYRVESTPFHPGDTVTFVAEVRQTTGGVNRGVSGETITFSLSPDNGTASLSTTSGTTGSNGEVRTKLTLSSSASGSYYVTATYGDGTTKTHSTGTVYNPNKPRGFILAMRSVSGSIEPGEIQTFTAEVQRDGNYVSGQTVAFSVSPDDGTVSLSTTSGTTDSNGRASTTLITESNSAGTYRVTATLSNSQSISSTATVETSAPPPPSRTIVLSISDLGPLNPGDSVTFTALVREGGNRLSGQTVAFSVSPDDETTSLSTASATTDSNGNASTILTLGSSASPGSYRVTATLDNGQSASNSTWIPSPPPPPPPPPELSIVVIHSPGSGEPGDWLTFIVEVQEDGSPASGKTVTFSISPDNGTLSFLSTSTATTGDNGRVARTLVLANDASGSYTVTASVGSVSVSRTATVETAPLPPDGPVTRAMYRVESTPFSPGDTVTFLAEVRQTTGGVNHGVSGETITFSLSPDNGTASLSSTSGTTNSNGEVRTKLTLSSSASGSYYVTATYGDGTTKTHGTGTVYNPNKPRGFGIGMYYHSAPIDPGGSMTFTVEVQRDGNWIAGQPVAFSVSPDDGTVSLSATSGITDSNGRASTTLSAGSDSAGAYRVTATLNNGQSISGTVTVAVTDEPPPPQQQQLDLAIGSDPTPQGTSVTVSLSQNGNPVGDQTVRFRVTPDDGTVSLSATSGITDSNGRASTTLSTGSHSAGLYTVTATLNDSQLTSGTVTVDTAPPPPILEPTALSIVSGDNQTGLTRETLMSPFVVEVRDQYDDLLEGVTVTFTVSTGGGSLSDTIVDTDANGLAQSTLTLGSDPGTYTVEVSVEGITEIVTFNARAELLEFNLSLPSDISLIHVPLKVRTVDGEAQTIESVSDLYAALGGADTVNYLITYDSDNQSWRSYFGDADQGSVTDKALADDTGILASMKTPVSVMLGGDALGTDGSSTITLTRGHNLVGLPLKDSRVTRVNDLFALEGIADSVTVITVLDSGEFKTVRRAGDLGDIEVTGGQSFILTAQQAATITISGDGWDNTSVGTMAAPPITMRGIQATGITPVLALSGSIVDGARRINSAGIRVTVKNLSVDSMVAAITKDADDTPSQVDYRLTVVDIASGRAAAIGDILEISAISPDASMGVEPLRYTVTTEDVRHSRIQLPTLVADKIPAETQLLPNYPNPFNPETWIPYRLAEDAFVTLTIYNSSGQVVRTLDIGHQTAAIYENQSKAVYWDGRNNLGESVASGVYFYTLTAGDYSATRKMLILK